MRWWFWGKLATKYDEYIELEIQACEGFDNKMLKRALNKQNKALKTIKKQKEKGKKLVNNTQEHWCKIGFMCICEYKNYLEQKWNIKIYLQGKVLKLQKPPIQTFFGLKDLIAYYNKTLMFAGLYNQDQLFSIIINFIDLIEKFNTPTKPM